MAAPKKPNTSPATESIIVFDTAEEFEKCANGYFDECDKNGVLYGEAGLCLYLSKHNKKHKTVTLRKLRDWWDGEHCKHLQDAVQTAYLRIQEQIDTNPVYHEKNMATRGIFLQKQKRFGGYQDKVETKNDVSFKVTWGNGVDKSDFD